MKLFPLSFIPVIFLAGNTAFAQTTPTSASAGLPAPWAIVSRGANSQIWERTVYTAGPSGQAIATKHHVTEIATGLNHWVNNEWVPSSAEIKLLPPGGGGFAAASTNCQQQVYFPADIYEGALREITPDGKVLTSHPFGISYDDGHQTVLLAALTNSVGELVASNQVVYPNAFAGLDADLRYTVTRAGFEQDVILHQRPADPQSLQLNPKTTKLQVLTEFFHAPVAKVVAQRLPRQAGMTLTNENLDFGVMKMPLGHAFLMGAQARRAGAAFAKEWLDVAGRHILVEQAPVLALTNELSQLMASAARPLDWGKSGAMLLAWSPKQPLPWQPSAKGSTAKFIAVALPPNQGLVLDYQTINGSLTGYDFQGDTTYYVSGNVYLYGACTNEGGAVLKYAANTAVTLETGATLQWRTSAYHPFVCTAKDDNSMGEPAPGSTGNPFLNGGAYANPALDLENAGYASATVSNLCVRFAQVGIMASWGQNVRDSQFAFCQEGISSPYYSYSIWRLRNVLFYYVNTCFFADSETLLTVDAENVTFDNISSVVIAGSQYGGWMGDNAILTATNCIFATIGSVGNDWVDILNGSHNGFYDCGPNNSGQFGDTPFDAYGNPFEGPFGGFGGGCNYLPNGCVFRGVGTTAGVDPSLLADLQTKTTYPPALYINQTISSPTTLAPRALANTGTPDLGYHYPILDYIFSQTVISADLTFEPGTAVGWLGWENQEGLPQALSFAGPNLAVNFYGLVNYPCYFVRCNAVQESDWSVDGGGTTGIAGSGQSPTLYATFTRFSALADMDDFCDANTVNADTIDNCEFWSGALGDSTLEEAGLFFHNCLFDRTAIIFSVVSGGNGDFDLQNCTLHGGSLTLDNIDNNVSAGIYDSAFDGTTITRNGQDDGLYSGYNAYDSGADQLPRDAHDQLVSNGFNWQSGPLGNYYLPAQDAPPPTQDGRKLIDRGNYLSSSLDVQVSAIASEPLSSFTTQTSQELDSGLVDIGYHYHVWPGPGVFVSGIEASSANDIATFDLPGGARLEQFGPQSEANGRGLAIYNGNFYYTSDEPNHPDIHVCSYGTDGSGPNPVVDSATFTDPDNRGGAIAALAFHYDPRTQKTELYALTGYGLPKLDNQGNTNYPEVWEIDPDPDSQYYGKPVPSVPNPIAIQIPVPDPQHGEYSTSDGFTVLPNGNFLVNDYDGDEGCTVYREYYSSGQNAGTQVPGGLYVNLSTFGLANGTGVTVAPDGNSLYFVAGIETGQNQTLVQTDMSAPNPNELGTWPISSSEIENIAVMTMQ